MPNITIISSVYPPEPPVNARMCSDLAGALAERGDNVTVVCPQPTRPLGTDYSAYSAPGRILANREGNIEIVRLPSFTSPQSKLIPRMRESWSFGTHCCLYLADRAVRPDVLYVHAWPLLAQALLAVYAKKQHIPIVLQIMDIYPESLMNKLPAIGRPLFYEPLRMLDRWTARKATIISVISESMRKTYVHDRRIPDERVVTIPTWQDEKVFDSVLDREEACCHYGVSSELFTFVYLGNIGPVAGVDLLVRAFHKADMRDAQLLIIGDGSQKNSCIEIARRIGAPNIIFISDPDARNVAKLQIMADVFLLPLKRGAGSSSIPSKLSAYMFSGRPVLATIDEDSDTAAVIHDAACGWIGPPEDQQWLSAKMKAIVAMAPRQLATLGANGREFALVYFSKTQGARQLAQTVLSAAEKSQ
jgi:glycosyltransferase involved in cell wall biosynthesis